MNKARLKKLLDLFEKEQWPELETLARSYIKAFSKDGTAWKALGAALENQKKDALPAFRRAVELLPNDPQAHFNLGNGLKWHGKKGDAVECYRKAIALKPDYAEAYSNMGNALQDIGEPYEALRNYWEGIKLAPHLVNIQLNMGNCYLAVGEHARAVKMYGMALEIKPDFIEANNAIIFAKDLMTMQTVDGAQSDRTAWAKRFADHLHEHREHDNAPDPERRLRIGYVSADFREHSAARSFGNVLLNHDHSQFEIFAYHNSQRDDDDHTRLFRKSVDNWKVTWQINDQKFSDLIREDKIDILVDLSGHTGGNRLLTFARKPAPIQITAWGYGTGTGMKAMDVFFADPVIVPQDERHLYAEDVRYMPCVVGSFWRTEFPEVSQLPLLEHGSITFGSLNRLSKVTEDTLRLWARVMQAIPNSCFVMKTAEFKEASAKARITAFFSALGITSDRILLLGGTFWQDHVKVYQEIDICLDPFPHGGGVTTLEGLMMGVPVITLRWPTTPGRASASILTNLGMQDWIAETQDEYVAKAIEKSNYISELMELRAGLRERFLASPVGNAVSYCRTAEAEYRHLWRAWCANKSVRAIDKQ